MNYAKAFVILIVVVLIGTALVTIPLGEEAKKSKYFTAKDAMKYATNKAIGWRGDAILFQVSAKSDRNLDGKDTLWSYRFYSPSTQEGDRVDTLYVRVDRPDGKWNHSTRESTYPKNSHYTLDDVSGIVKDLDSDDAAKLAARTDTYNQYFTEGDDMWVDYTLMWDYWRISICDMEDEAWYYGVAVVVEVYEGGYVNDERKQADPL